MKIVMNEFLCPVITRVDIAWLCVATDDPNPLHLDQVFAREKAGYQDVVVPGTMLVGWIGEYLEAWANGPENVLDWRIRFTAPVWPGEQIKLSGTVVQEADGVKQCELIAATAEDKVVARVFANIRI